MRNRIVEARYEMHIRQHPREAQSVDGVAQAPVPDGVAQAPVPDAEP